MLFSVPKTDHVSEEPALNYFQKKFPFISITATVTDEKDKNSPWFVMAKG